MVALISHAVTAHLALQRLKSVSWNLYITLVISHQRAQESSLLTEKVASSHQRHNREQNDGKFTSLGSLLAVPVKLSNGIAERNNNQTYIHR